MDADAIVIDPDVPQDIRQQLAAAPARRLVKFGAPQPEVIPPPPSKPEQVFTSAGRTAVARVVTSSLLLVVAVAVWVTCAATSSTGAKEGLFFLGLASTVAWLNRFVGTPSAVAAARANGWKQLPPTTNPDHPKWQGLHAVTAYHGRYVLPRYDLDQEARRVWARAVDAASKLERSDMVTHDLIDSVQVATVLPYHLWDIAERLARLTALRAGHEAVLRGVDPDDPGIAAVLRPQQRAQVLGGADVEQRVRRLEEFAELAAKADAAKRRQEAVRQLGELNDAHRELLARIGDDVPASELAGQITMDAHAIIEQADEAVRRANDAGRSLALPIENLPSRVDTPFWARGARGTAGGAGRFRCRCRCGGRRGRPSHCT